MIIGTDHDIVEGNVGDGSPHAQPNLNPNPNHSPKDGEGSVSVSVSVMTESVRGVWECMWGEGGGRG